MQLTTPTRTVTRCIVCGFSEVRTDEVVDRGIVMLSECPRCDHRSTWRVPGMTLESVTWPERKDRPAPARVVRTPEEKIAAA